MARVKHYVTLPIGWVKSLPTRTNRTGWSYYKRASKLGSTALMATKRRLTVRGTSRRLRGCSAVDCQVDCQPLALVPSRRDGAGPLQAADLHRWIVTDGAGQAGESYEAASP
jgi:hypothetical protein